MSDKSRTATDWSAWTAPPLQVPDAQASGDISATGFAIARQEALESARAEGYAAGLSSGQTEGYQRGFDEGNAAGAQKWEAQREAQAAELKSLLHGIGHALTELDAVIPDALVDTSLAAAGYLANTTIKQTPARIRKLIASILQQDPIWGGDAHLDVNPDDLTLLDGPLAKSIEAAGLVARGDPAIHRGGCVITGSEGKLDARLETRWKALVARLHTAPSKPIERRRRKAEH